MKIRLCLPVWRGVRLRTKYSGREALVKLIRSASLSDEVIVGIHATGFHSKRVKAGDNPRDVAGKKPRQDICAIRLVIIELRGRYLPDTAPPQRSVYQFTGAT